MNRAIFLVFLAIGDLGFQGNATAKENLPAPLVLPPGLTQVLPVERTTSYFGDALRAVHCPDDADNPYGTCGNLLFGGLVMVNSHVTGKIQIKFYPPVNNIAHFEVSHPGGLSGEDSYLTAPQSYRLPVKDHLVFDDCQALNSGDLNLLTGEVTNLAYNIHFYTSALLALSIANPKLTVQVIQFPGVYGSSWAKFEQRPDGLLDYTFYGTTFHPLGNSIEGDMPQFPLGVCDLNLNCATVPAAGTSLHPQLHVSTKPLSDPPCAPNCPSIPYNTIQEYSSFGYATYFGDKFTLNIPELGGEGTGRSHLIGRFQVQFGEPVGGTVPFAVSSLPPAGLLAVPPKTPLSISGLSVGLLGHNEYLRFPQMTYLLQDVAFADDPFDLQLGAIDLRTGRVVGDLLYRGFIAQDLLFTLLEQNDGRIAPDSFYFRGPALFEKGPNGETVFRFDGTVHVDFTGYRYPSPDHVKAHSFVAGPNSALDPFLKIQAMAAASTDTPSAVKSGSGTLISSTGDTVSYSFSIPCNPAGQSSAFQYTNNNATKGGTFKMTSLASVECTNSRTSTLSPGDYDIVSFSGFGSWSTDRDNGLHLATVQISFSKEFPYASVMIDGGLVSNANLKPAVAPVP